MNVKIDSIPKGNVQTYTSKDIAHLAFGEFSIANVSASNYPLCLFDNASGIH